MKADQQATRTQRLEDQLLQNMQVGRRKGWCPDMPLAAGLGLALSQREPVLVVVKREVIHA